MTRRRVKHEKVECVFDLITLENKKTSFDQTHQKITKNILNSSQTLTNTSGGPDTYLGGNSQNFLRKFVRFFVSSRCFFGVVIHRK